jgi:predicted site-specific integrase-resolvase
MTASKALLDEDEVAEMIGVRPQTLAVWRCTGKYDLPFVRVGRLVRYQIQDVLEWLQSRRVVTGASQRNASLVDIANA